MTLTENGLTAFSDVITACRPCYPGHYNDQAVELLGITLHTIESKGQLGNRIMAGSPGSNDGILGVSWMNQQSTEASVHAGTDDTDRVFCLSLDRQCWGAGPHANLYTWQVEQAGDAAMSRGDWLTAQGTRVIANTAQVVAALIQEAARRGVVIPVRFATPQQVLDGIANGRPFGLVPHSMWTALFPQDTTHTDFGDGYPQDVLLSMVNQLLGTTPTPPESWSDMATQQQIQDLISTAVAAEVTSIAAALQTARNADYADKPPSNHRVNVLFNNLTHGLRADGTHR